MNDSYDNSVHETLRAIKENDGYPGPVREVVRRSIVPKYATYETSPHTGLITQWTLTPAGKKQLSFLNGYQRRREREKTKPGYRRWERRPSYHRETDAPVPLTIEVLDALKSIREEGDPNTDKLEILARIQRQGVHGAKYVKGSDGQNHLIHGALAECRNGVWTLTNAGIRAEAGHIRKSECAQFGGKVR